MTEWYLYEDDDVVGPFSTDELEGRVEPETLVCPAGSEDWVAAEEHEELQPLFSSSDEPEKPDDSASSLSFDSDTDSASTETSESEDETKSGTTTKDEAVSDHSSTESEDTIDDPLKDDVMVGDLEPTLDTLKRIAREANAKDLRREFQDFWDEYDREEQKIIYQEMEHLGIIPDE